MKCKFHPLELAKNYCEFCDAAYCEACSDEAAAGVVRSRANRAEHNCFVCSKALEPIESSELIPPFWGRLPEVYRYPLNTQAIITLIVVSFVSAFLGNAVLFLIIPFAAMILYSFACLRETATGSLEAPGIEVCFENSAAPLVYVVIAFVVLGYGTYKVFEYFGLGFGLMASAFFILATPAIVIIIAVEEKLLPALNPGELFSVMRATGISYFVMLLFIIIMTSSVYALVAFFGGEANTFIANFFQSLISNYYTVVTFHIMGYLVYQNQYALGFKTKSNARRGDSLVRSASEREKAQLEVLIKAGKYEAASDIAQKQLREPDAKLWDWSRAFTLMCISDSKDNAKRMFQDYASKLEAVGESDKLVDAYLQLKKSQPKFVIQDHEQRLRVADSLFETGQYAHVVNLLHMFHQESVDNSKITRALKLLSESLSSMPGREKLASQYQARYQLQLKKV